MSKPDDVLRAFPSQHEIFPSQEHPNGGIWFDKGMSLRDYFAGQVLMGQMAVPDNRPCPSKRVNDIENWRAEMRAQDAEYCYAMADAMLAERTRPAPGDGERGK